jgi:hypothetical protein
MIPLQLLLVFGLLWAVSHAWQYGGERNWAGFANTEFYFWLHVTRLSLIVLTILSAIATVLYAHTILHTLAFDACSIS